MQQLGAADTPRVVVFVPRWLPPKIQQQRFSHHLTPILGALRTAGYGVTFLEEGHDGKPDESWRAIVGDALLVVVWAGEMYPALQIEGLRAMLDVVPEGMPVVVGGGFFGLLDARELDLDRRIRAVVHGPGELVLPRVVDAVATAAPLDGVGGITLLERNRVARTAAPRRRRFDPAWNDVLAELDLARYAGPEPTTFDNDEPALQVHTGSGCAKRCHFCFDENTPYGVFPATSVVDAVETTIRRGRVRQIAIGELDFFVDHRRVVSVAEQFLDRGLELRWFALGSVCDLMRLSDEEMELLARSGCHRIEIGTESGSDPLLVTMRKRHRAADVLPLVRRLRNAGIRTTHNLLFGVPEETREDRHATLKLGAAIVRADREAHLHFRAYQIIPSTTTGSRVLTQVPNFPRTLQELHDYRFGLAAGIRALPWLDATEERWIRDLTEYVLPLAFHTSGVPARGYLSRFAASGLRRLARVRARFDIRLGIHAERRLASRIGNRLATTFVP
ncbi:MAG: radical SAM protein [Planctomycetes bacterium]|nr:radical SAM protein [Planctomycetota bacterium]MCB9890447.1 radical SAM protein [Planctomycetota bacterium]MCB9917688.1 radical SAM protein [Planctomycetota bacterium]